MANRRSLEDKEGFELNTACKWPAPDLLPRAARGMYEGAFRCTNVTVEQTNHDQLVLHGGYSWLPRFIQDPPPTVEVRATFQDEGECVTIEAVTFDQGEHWDILKTELTARGVRHPGRPVDAEPVPKPKPLNQTEARQAIASAEEVFADDAKKDRVRGGKRHG